MDGAFEADEKYGVEDLRKEALLSGINDLRERRKDIEEHYLMEPQEIDRFRLISLDTVMKRYKSEVAANGNRVQGRRLRMQ